MALVLHASQPPKHVAIVGLGPSMTSYASLVTGLGGRHRYCDEVWAINALGNVLDCDLVFHMDDVRIQEIRAAARPESNIAALLAWLRTSRIPVMTSRAHPEYPALVEFPLQKVLQDLRHDYLNNTAAYAMAYAIHIGAEKISLYGCDYTYPNAHDAERGRACLEFWMGFAAARGVQLAMPKTSSLMDAVMPARERLYGYDTVDVEIAAVAGDPVVSFHPRAALPTAAEIEARYDHSAHPNPLVDTREDAA